MGQRLIISESEKNRIKGLYENNMEPNEQGIVNIISKKLKNSKIPDGKIPNSKRPFDGMVADCLKSEGFVTDDTNGKYEFSMTKRKMGQNGTMKLDYIIRSTEDPASFTTYLLIDGKLNSNGFFKIGTSTNCKTIVDSAHLLINVKQNNQITDFKR